MKIIKTWNSVKGRMSYRVEGIDPLLSGGSAKMIVAFEKIIDNAPLDHMGTGTLECARLSEREWNARVAHMRKQLGYSAAHIVEKLVP